MLVCVAGSLSRKQSLAWFLDGNPKERGMTLKKEAALKSQIAAISVNLRHGID